MLGLVSSDPNMDLILSVEDQSPTHTVGRSSCTSKVATGGIAANHLKNRLAM
jgi:hypothetical protein